MDITILPIPTWTQKLLSRLPGWKETTVASGSQIVRHAHKFLAIYFTFGIPIMETGNMQRSLPAAAMVLVPVNVAHGWIGPQRDGIGVVGHFHAGHRTHQVESVETGA